MLFEQEFEDNSASSQIFWLLKESELTPSNANILDGRYAVFGYVTENEDNLADLKVGDVIESIKVVSGLDNLVNPTYKIAGQFCAFAIKYCMSVYLALASRLYSGMLAITLQSSLPPGLFPLLLEKAINHFTRTQHSVKQLEILFCFKTIHHPGL